MQLSTDATLKTIPRLTVVDRLARAAVLAQLARLQHGELVLIDGAERRVFGRAGPAAPLQSQVRVHDPRCYRAIAGGGSIGAGEAYMQGYWSCDDLTAAVRLLLRNRAVLDGMERGFARFGVWLAQARHGLRRNTRAGSQRNIGAHYDLGNDFFALFLDPTMMYSCAVFEQSDSDLHRASLAKLERVCRKLELTSADHVLEIGTGWGGFAVYAASHYGCRVTTATISQRQHEFALARVREAGLSERVTVLLKDYRDLTGVYDKLVSIEMIEAVGHRYLDTYFRQCSRLLKPDGMMLLQSITIADQRYEQARRSVDFIQRYIFPGGCLPSVAVIANWLARVTDLRLFHLEDIGPYYALTLLHWRKRLFDRLEEARALGYSDAFLRMWEFYLCYCEGAFIERALGNVQILLTKPSSVRRVV